MAIGDVRPPSSPVSTPSPRVSSEAFGAGITRGLRNMATSILDFEAAGENIKDAEITLANAYRTRDDKFTRSRYNVGLLRLATELDMQVAQMQLDAPTDPDGFTNQADELVSKRLEEFASTIPAHLRPEFDARIEGVRNGLVSKSFDFELQGEARAFGIGLAELRQQAVNDILSGQTTIEVWEENLNVLLEDSPLDAATTLELRLETQRMLETAALETDLRAHTEPRSNFNPQGVTAPAKTALAKLEQLSGMTFNINSAYRSPEHNESVGGARRSQHMHGNAFDIDVSHLSQDERVELIRMARAAGFGGVGVYANSLHFDVGATRHWGPDYKAGSLPAWAAEAVGAPRGDAGEAPSSVLQNDRYNSVPWHEREQLWNRAQSQAQQNLIQQQQDAAAVAANAYNGLLESMTIGGATPSMDQIMNQADQFGMNLQQIEGLRSAWTQQNANQIAMQGVAQGLATPGFFFDKGDKDTREAVNLYSREKLLGPIQQMDEAGVANAVIPALQNFGYIPAPVDQMFSRMIASGNPEHVEFALQALSDLRGVSPTTFDGLNDRSREAALFYETNKGVMPDDLLHERLRQRQSPEWPTIYGQFSEIAQNNMKAPELMKDFLPVEILGEMNLPEVELDVRQQFALSREFAAIYKDQFTLYREHDAAYEASAQILSKRWGETSVSGTPLPMRFPPEKSGYKPHMDSFDYMGEQIREGLGLVEGQRFKLFSDDKTEYDISQGELPRYGVLVEDVDENGRPLGTFSPAPDPSGQNYYGHIRFSYTDEMKQEELEYHSWRNEEATLERGLARVDREIDEIEAEMGMKALSMNEALLTPLREELSVLKKEREELQLQMNIFREEAPKQVVRERTSSSQQDIDLEAARMEYRQLALDPELTSNSAKARRYQELGEIIRRAE